MPINIHGKEYQTVAERLKKAHDDGDLKSVITEVISSNYSDKGDVLAVVKATIETKKGTFTGISSSNPSKAIEKTSPYEVAETSAVGRALAFAGYAGTEIASYDEMLKAGAIKKGVNEDDPPF